ncbi:MAG: VIT1/CCC1 transporter family protein [Anaerolineae bacterium]
MWAFISDHLAPVDRLAEIIYALLIILTFTLATKAINADADARQLMLAALGCNIAWGMIDGVMYILTSVFERGRLYRFVTRYRQSPDPVKAMQAIANELDDTLAPLASEDERKQLYAGIVTLLTDENVPARPGATREDVLGAVAIFAIVVLASLPPIVPFFVFWWNALFALRVSNMVTIGMLFVVGWNWARYTGANRLKAGLALMGLGIVMVLISIPLGG